MKNQKGTRGKGRYIAVADYRLETSAIALGKINCSTLPEKAFRTAREYCVDK